MRTHEADLRVAPAAHQPCGRRECHCGMAGIATPSRLGHGFSENGRSPALGVELRSRPIKKASLSCTPRARSSATMTGVFGQGSRKYPFGMGDLNQSGGSAPAKKRVVAEQVCPRTACRWRLLRHRRSARSVRQDRRLGGPRRGDRRDNHDLRVPERRWWLCRLRPCRCRRDFPRSRRGRAHGQSDANLGLKGT